jgi:hypothetical protein
MVNVEVDDANVVAVAVAAVVFFVDLEVEIPQDFSLYW